MSLDVNELYSTFDTRSSSTDSSYSSNKTHLKAQTSTSNNSIKLPYPVLSDHRDPSSVQTLLQKETQTTSKKILDVNQQIDDCEKRLTSNLLSDTKRKSLKYERVQRKQQLDALKKHERRVNLQIDYITTKSEIKGLEDKHQQLIHTQNFDENKQIEILLKKLKQKLDQMKIYMRTRNEQMKKQQVTSSQKSQQRLSTSDLSRKRPSSLTTTSHSYKHFKSTAHSPTKSHPIVRFLNKTTDVTIPTANSSSPTTPTSSSSTLSPLIASTSTGHTTLHQNGIPSINEDGELDVEFDIDELFNEDSYSKEFIQKRFKS